MGYRDFKEGTLGRRLVFLFLAAPCGLWDLSSLARNWTQATTVKPGNPNHWATTCWGFFNLCTFVPTRPPPHSWNLKKTWFSCFPLGVFETAFTQILVVNVHPLGIHVVLSGWVVQAHLNGWSRRNMHKVMRNQAGWACGLFLYFLSPKYKNRSLLW